MVTAVTEKDIETTLRALGIAAGDLVLVHSSYKSLGIVDGGADAVIRGFENVLGKAGTLVMPTLCQVDFDNSYKTWYMDKPSDVGYLTEYFRKQPYVYRSNQATHSVAARGKLAYQLTCEHTAYGPHLCPFGEYAFADSSPWMKMYNLGAKIVFLGVSTVYNTMKHAVEARYVEELLAQISDTQKRAELTEQVSSFVPTTDCEVWPFYNGERMEKILDAKGYIAHARCGNAEVLCVDMKAFCDAAYAELAAAPEQWCDAKTLNWVRRCQKAATA